MDIEALQAKAAVLVEALPYIQRFAGETLVVKYGGHAMTDPDAARSFAQEVVLLQAVGLHVIVVHGGGPQIGRILDRLGIQSSFKAGMRVTDEATMEIVRMVLVGQVNQEVVAAINHAGGRAIGLSGADGNLLRARRVTVDGEDVGRVGVVEAVDEDEVKLLTGGGLVPVIAPVGVDRQGQPLNINADLVAAAVAGHVQARKLLLLTDVPGVKGPDGEVVATLERDIARAWIANETIAGGMIPKVECALEALDAGVRKVHIVDGRVRHALLLELFTNRGVGTEIV